MLNFTICQCIVYDSIWINKGKDILQGSMTLLLEVSHQRTFVNDVFIVITVNYGFLIFKDNSRISLENQEGVKSF